MIRSDLHVHSKASKRPSEWFLQKVGARESYTDIDTLYKTAKQRGMDFVTVTDHNTIEGGLELVEKYPHDTFLSLEVTTYFPENNCKIHVLVFDVTPEQFHRIDQIRRDIYRFRDYIKEQNLAYSVAHGFYSINHKLDMNTLEKLILLFDVFEGLNGARNRCYNETWQNILTHITQEQVQSLARKHGIEPISRDPWVKSFTGGSDDHAGIFIGQTTTICRCDHSKEAFINAIRNKQTACSGRCNDYKSFAFSIYKIFCDYSSQAQKNAPGGVVAFVNSVIFEERQSRLKKWVTLRKIKNGKQIKDKIILTFFEDVYNWAHNKNLDSETKIVHIYRSMGLLLDEFFKLILESFVKDFSKGDIGKLFRNLVSSFPAFFISIPFFSSLRHLSKDRDLILALKKRYIGEGKPTDRKVLWFSDTMTDLNGVSVTLNRFRRQAEERNLHFCFVTCSKDRPADATDSIMYLPCIYSITPEFYTNYTCHFPSLLASIEMIYQYQPERIIVSTPGPVGILGMIMAGILGIDCVTIYHTDFAAQAALIFKDEALAGLIRSFTNRFYSFSTHIKVPTRAYMEILAEQGYHTEKMSIFKRGYSPRALENNELQKTAFRQQAGIKDGFTLMWAGRISRDKNIEFLFDVYTRAAKMIPELNLIICGDGPDYQMFSNRYKLNDRIHFTGYIENTRLQDYYDISDMFVFPSTTDTFGMVILEAQARGLYCLVTDVGGPREIIKPGLTGAVLTLSKTDGWVEQILRIKVLKSDQPHEFEMMRQACHRRISEKYNWENALLDILGESSDHCDSRLNGYERPSNSTRPVHPEEPLGEKVVA